MEPSFYRRTLPCPPAVDFTSVEGKTIFQEALVEGTASIFFKLISQFHTQNEPAFCGLASTAMVLNALSIDPARQWKGSVWRHYDEWMLDCCESPEVVKKEGITFDKVACLFRCEGAEVDARPALSSSLEDFREALDAVCRSSDKALVVSYSRCVALPSTCGCLLPSHPASTAQQFSTHYACGRTAKGCSRPGTGTSPPWGPCTGSGTWCSFSTWPDSSTPHTGCQWSSFGGPCATTKTA